MPRFLSLVALLISGTAALADEKPKKLLLVTHSGGFVHKSVAVAEEVLKEIGPKHGYEVTCWRYTGDPAHKDFDRYKEEFRKQTKLVIEPENCGRINKETLKNFDCVLFFTTGTGPKRKNIGPLTDAELADLQAWVKAGGAFAGTHCAADTMYETSYGEMLGAFFRTHPAIQKVKLKLEDTKHPAAAGMEDGMIFEDEYYIFDDKPYGRDKVHVILSIDPETFKLEKVAPRNDRDYALAWCKEHEKGKVFYTGFGHRDETWKDQRFQKHLFGGLDWATGRKPGDASPSKK